MSGLLSALSGHVGQVTHPWSAPLETAQFWCGLASRQDLMNSRRSGLRTSAWVVSVPCGMPEYVFSVVLQPGGYGLVVGLGAAGHALAPPVCDYRLRRLGARTVESIERTLRDCPVKFRPVAKHACPNRVEPLPRL